MSKFRGTCALLGIVAVAFAAGRWVAPGAAFGAPEPAPKDKKKDPLEERNRRVAPLEPAVPLAADAMAAWTRAGMPGPGHAVLDGLTGSWSCEGTVRLSADAPPIRYAGNLHRAWVLDGRFIREETHMPSPLGGTFKGLGFLGYDNVDERYESIWLDNASTAAVIERGIFDPDARTIRFRGAHRDAVSGRMITTRTELDLAHADRHVLTARATDESGREYTAMQAVFQRRP